MAFESLEPRTLLAAAPIISEFLAINDSPNGLKDGDNALNDWLELHNAGDQPVDLSGWRLRDGANEWVFPQSAEISPAGNPTQYEELLRLSPGEYLIVMASGKGGSAAYVNANGYYLDGAGYLHTNFSLKGGGEYLGLLNPSGTMVHEYDEYPSQTADISYGIAQDVEQTLFVAPGATARYFVPTGTVAGWTGTGFNDAAWSGGPTGLGYVSTVPGFAVWNYKANTAVGNLSTALSVIANPNMQSAVYTANPSTINYFNSGGQGHYTEGEANFPGFPPTDQEDFVVEAKAYLKIPTAGQWTFGVNSDDGFQLSITGATTTAVTNSNTPLGSDTISWYEPRGPADTLGVFNFPSAGTYEMRLVFYERGGGSGVELFAKQGAAAGWDGNFFLVGAAGAGRPEVSSRPMGQTGGSAIFNLVETDVEGVLKNANSSLLVRMPFNVTNPAQYQSLTLRMKYDDGFVAYLNGYEVARRNAPGAAGQALAWNAAATAQRSDAEAAIWETLDLTAHLGRLQAGTNVLAIQALNSAAGDGDFLVLPELSQILTLGLGEHYFATATPGDANSAEFWLHVEDTKFSLDRGLYEKLPAGQNYWLTITTATPGATIRYTLDGSSPSATHGTVFTSPIPFNQTTTVRAAAFKPLHAPSDVDTQTYIFYDDVMAQPAQPAGFPTDWNGTAADYEMDPDVLGSVDPQVFRDALQSIPTMSIVMNMDDLFNPSTGIYVNPLGEGEAWERPLSLEYFDPNGTGEFQVNAGVRIYGGAFRGFNLSHKKSFRVLFNAQYGATKLDFPLFGEDAADSFDSIILRAGSNDAWNNWGAENTQYIVDEYMRRTQLALGEPASHGTYVHLYINGVYWGLYNPVERPDSAFASTYMGGEKENWDAIHDGIATSGGSTATWDALLNFVSANDMSTMTAYQRIQGNNPDGTPNPAYDYLLDVENYIAYMFSNIWGGTGDWPWHNWYTACQRPPDETGFKFFNWDSEGAIIIWSDLNTNVTGVSDGAAVMYAALRANPEFRMRFADLAHRYLFNGGAATAAPSRERYEELVDTVEQAILLESARWGDQRGGTPYTQATWESRADYVLNTYMPQRPAIVLSQLRNANLYPSVTAPSFRVDGQYQHGGPINQGASFSITAPAGTIYYTTDGTDPRLLGGEIAPGARTYSGAITLNAATHVKSRVYSGGQWSALNEATFYIDLAPYLRVTEIMYHPTDPSIGEIAQGYASDQDFEFIELKNISTTTTVPLEGLRFSKGIDFSFPPMTLAPGQSVLAVKNEPAFRYRYPGFTGTIAGQYQGALSSSGERIVLDMAVGGVVQDFEYQDGWYGHTDGEGFSLTIRDPLGAKTLWGVNEGWRASEQPGGTPGTDDAALGYQPVTPGAIVINEVLSHSDLPFGDAIEIRNVGATAVNVSGWFLSDQKAGAAGNSLLTKYSIPATAPLQPGAYLVLYQNTHFDAAFALSELGDDLYLSSNAGGAAGGYREHVDFGHAPQNVPFGLHVKSTEATDFTLLSALTLGADNAAPYIEDLVINEVMYHAGPPTAEELEAGFLDEERFEFIELQNTSTTAAHDLRQFYLGDGIGFSFGWYQADAVGSESWTLEPGATATWNATLPAGQANYEVFARWDLLDAQGLERKLDGKARYAITHASGSALVVRDQTPELDDEGPGYMDANGWVSLGTYTFDGSGRVVLTRGSDDPDNWTIADRVKFVNIATQAEVVVDNPALDSWHTAHGPVTLDPGQRVVIVRDQAAFNFRYDAASNGIVVAGAYNGSLANEGEPVKLFRRGAAEPSGYLPYYRIDHVNYGDQAPWPAEADGEGFSLVRRRDASGEKYGNDPVSWEAGNLNGTPGGANLVIDRTPPTVPQNLAVHVSASPATFTVTWSPAQDPQSAVQHYLVYRDGALLAITTTTTYSDTDVLPVFTYRYSVAAVNRDGFASAASAEVSAAVPGIVSHSIPDANHVELVFSEALNPATAGVLGNYTLSGEAFSSVTLTQGNTRVVLTTSEQLVIGNTYLVAVRGVTTLSGNEMPDPLTVNIYYEPQGSGTILREYWTGIGSGNGISDLTSSPNYPNTPTGQSFPTLFEGPVDWNEAYGTRFRGYVHPPVSGQYTFWISSDDNSVLYLSTDANPANKVQIASVSNWTGSRQWEQFAEQRSAAITLAAGRKYYIEALHKEGGGGDNIAVRWQLPGGVWENPANPAEPIPGIRLSPYLPDTTAPTANVIDVAPDPRATPVSQMTIVFSEEVTGFDLADLRLTRDGGSNLLTAAQTLTTANNVSFTLGNLATLTEAPGTYTLTLAAAGSNIRDVSGNALAVDAADTWTTVLDALMVQIPAVTPDPRNAAVDQLTLVFSEAVTGFDLADLQLTRDGGPNLLTAAQTLTTADNATFTLGNLAGITLPSGTYVLTLTAADSSIRDQDGNYLSVGAVETWSVDSQPPTVAIVTVAPDPRDALLDQVTIVFSEPIVGFDLADLSLTRDGGSNLLTGSETLTTTDNATWTLNGLAAHTATGAGGAGSFVAFNDHVALPGTTHVNATSYAANGTAAGALKDIATGAAAGVTLAISHSGANFAGASANPASGTDAYQMFHGYVDFSSAEGSSLELEAANGDYHLHDFSNLDTGNVVTYSFHGTAIRGGSGHTRRWTKVTLEGAVAATADHSLGVGIVVLSATEVALWTGYNSAADQGFVVGWTGIDPGPDGQFSIRSEQYTGAIPVSVAPGGLADDSKGYGLTALRLEAIAPSEPIPGEYVLALNAAGSGIQDVLGNPLTAGASDTFTIDTQPPAAVIAPVTPDPRVTPVETITITFNEAVTGFDLADLTLTRGGGGNLLTAAQTLATTDSRTWTLGNLGGLTAAGGNYVLTLTAAASGISDLAGHALAVNATESWTTIPGTITGTSGNDLIRIVCNASDPAKVDVFVNNPGPVPNDTVFLADVPSWQVLGGEGDDELTVDFSLGNPLAAGGLVFQGGGQSAGDMLRIAGSSGNDSVNAAGNQVTLLGAGIIEYASVEFFSFDLGAGQDHLTVDGPLLRLGAGGVISVGTAVTVTGGGALDLGLKTHAVRSVAVNDGSIVHGVLSSASYTAEEGSIGASLAGAAGLTKTGAGVVVLSAANSYLGGTTVQAGTLIAASPEALPAGRSLTIGASGTVVLSSGSALVALGNAAGSDPPSVRNLAPSGTASNSDGGGARSMEETSTAGSTLLGGSRERAGAASRRMPDFARDPIAARGMRKAWTWHDSALEAGAQENSERNWRWTLNLDDFDVHARQRKKTDSVGKAVDQVLALQYAEI